MRAPSSVSPPNTGSSGSSALAPATIRTSAPARLSAVSSSAITRGAPPANRTGKRRLPNHSAFCWSAPSKRARCLASRRSWATAPSVDGRKPRTATSPPAAPGVLLVEVTGLYREDVDLVPGRREQRCGGRRREARALLNGDLARRVPHVVAEHAVDEALERRRLPSLRDRLHRSGGREAGAIGGWPETRCDPAAFCMSPFIPPGAGRPAQTVGGLTQARGAWPRAAGRCHHRARPGSRP